YLNVDVQQLAGYLVVSASSVAVPVIQHMYNGTSLRKAATVSLVEYCLATGYVRGSCGDTIHHAQTVG
ncbi:UNVERIFIED_CONTAM: hypothetical protein Sangu_1675100, partial [Sesamum angustifolium]